MTDKRRERRHRSDEQRDGQDRRLHAENVSRMRSMRSKAAILLFFLAFPLLGEEAFRPDIDKAVAEVLAKTGAPSASIAVVKEGKIAYAHAYGTARLDPP